MRPVGALMSLQPGRAPVLARGPGALGLGGVADIILFGAGDGLLRLDLFPAFWRDEAPLLDWKEHFLAEDEREALLAILEDAAEDDVEEDLMFSKNALEVLGSEMMDDV